jgi:multiple sugar transport system permease protein
MAKLKPIDILRYTVTLALAVFFLAPFIWMASQSLKGLAEFYRLPPHLIPNVVRWDNYAKMLAQFPIVQAAVNTFFVASVVTVIQLVTASMAGFAFATLRFRGSRILFFTMLTQTMLPVAVLLIPLFKVTMSLGLVGNVWGMIIPFTFTAFGTFLMAQYFRGVPRELFEAARVDGASYFRIWSGIYLPLAPPALATLGVLVFVFYWNSLLWPLLISGGSAKAQTLPVLLAQLMGVSASYPHLIMAGAALAVFPPLVIFVALQRFFVAGLTAGSVKS